MNVCHGNIYGQIYDEVHDVFCDELELCKPVRDVSCDEWEVCRTVHDVFCDEQQFCKIVRDVHGVICDGHVHDDVYCECHALCKMAHGGIRDEVHDDLRELCRENHDETGDVCLHEPVRRSYIQSDDQKSGESISPRGG